MSPLVWTQPQLCSVPVSVLLLPVPAAPFGDKCPPNATGDVPRRARLRESPSELAPSFHWHREREEEREPRPRSSQCWASEGAGRKMPSKLTLSVTRRPPRCSQPHRGAVTWAGGQDRGGVLGGSKGFCSVFSLIIFTFRVVLPDLPLSQGEHS